LSVEGVWNVKHLKSLRPKLHRSFKSVAAFPCRTTLNIKFNVFPFTKTKPFKDPVPGISAIPDEANARYFHVIIAGPDSSPFAGF